MNDLTGMRFGSLTVISPTSERKNNSPVWVCRCDCGEETKASSRKLTNHLKKSCGCRWVKNGRYADGNGPEPKLAGVWKQLKQRCGNPNNKDYRYYGARGVMVCEEWQSFRGFEAWALDNGYREGLTIDRIDGNGNYSPDNCHWIPASENCKKQNRKKAPHDQQTSINPALPALQTPA
jgi:hypothetical protein